MASWRKRAKQAASSKGADAIRRSTANASKATLEQGSRPHTQLYSTLSLPFGVAHDEHPDVRPRVFQQDWRTGDGCQQWLYQSQM